MMTYGLTEQTIYKINQIFAQYPRVHHVLIYGSRAKGNYTPGSDIDLTLIGPDISHQNLMEICWRLDELLLAYTFDVSVFHQINNPDLIDHIQRVGLEFYNQNPDRHNNTHRK